MGSKRKYDETANNDNIHESRRIQVYNNNPKPPKKSRTKESKQINKITSTSSINAIKKRLRDVNRRLERSGTLSADIKIQDERARDTYQQQLAEAEAEKLRQRMIKKYHMVRFFERQKASRLIKRTRKLILAAESTETVKSLEKQLYEAEVDLNYTLYHPLSEVYISLYPKKPSFNAEDEDVDSTTVKKPPIWSEIEEAMANGTLEKIRNRISIKPVNPRLLTKKQIKNKSQDISSATNEINHRQKRIKSENSSNGKLKVKVNTRSIELNESQTGLSKAEEDSDEGFFE